MEESIFRIVFTLAKKQPWLGDKHDALQNLLYSDCESEEERTLILELLERFQHVSSEKFSELLHELVESIITQPSISSENTQLVAMSGDYSTDSAQFILYALKPILEKSGWRDHFTVTNFQRSWSEFNKKDKKHNNIILIDEFIGSGRTVLGRVNTLKRIYLEKDVDINIYVKVLGCSRVGLETLSNNNINIEYMLLLDKGISDYYDSDTTPTKIQLMKRLESILSSNYRGRDLPSLGYGETESLYFREGGNTPNSVFPIFWWPFYNNNTDRMILMNRAMGDA